MSLLLQERVIVSRFLSKKKNCKTSKIPIFAYSDNIKTMTKEEKIRIEVYRADTSTFMPLPYAEEGIRAGFPSPAQDYMELSIDLNKELVGDATATFYGRVIGDSMIDEGIEEGDILVIDKSLMPQDGDLCVCFVDGDFTLKRLKLEDDHGELVPSNPAYKPITVTSDNNFMVWGVVTYTIKKNRRKRR
jgi:DNA polymerase V